MDIIDFDPLTPEGQIDINDDEMESLIPREGEPEDSFFTRLRHRLGNNFRRFLPKIKDFAAKEHVKLPEYLELSNFDERERNQEDAVERIKERYPQADTRKFISWVDEFNQVMVKLVRKGSKAYPLFVEDQINPNLPSTITKALSVESVMDRLEEIEKIDEYQQGLEERLHRLREESGSIPEIESLKDKISQQNTIINDFSSERTQLLQEKASLEEQIRQKEKQLRQAKQAFDELDGQFIEGDNQQIEEQIREVEELKDNIEDLTNQKTELEERLGVTTKQKIRRALLKYGLPAVVAAGLATGIGFIIDMLKGAGNGVKKMGDALAKLGKKMAGSIPGLLGSVLSLVLKTAGSLLKFVGNNIWLLVVAIGMVIYKEIQRKR